MSYKNEELLDNADYCMQEGYIDDAVTILTDILRDDPLFGKAHNQLGYIYETKILDLKRAEEHYAICLKTDPEYCAVYYNAAVLYSTLKKYDELTELLTKAEKVPGIDKVIINTEWAIMNEEQGKYDEAIIFYKKAIAKTFDSKTIVRAIRSIQRCEKKKTLLEGKLKVYDTNRELGNNYAPDAVVKKQN